jgi:alkanesulfonate monooxygenase SsuD/methylene tetrahydromethanopterin reductase-like flavin-dependent oxidoreductase (luciferase family)
MRFDLSGCGAGLDESASSLLELGPVAEALGYDGLWINEEHFGQGSRACLSPILLATALAMRTRTIRIGFSVLVLPLFEPIRLAEEIATLDVLSEGRVDLGISRGNTSRYFEAWGLGYEDRSLAFDASFERLIRYWTEPKVQVGSRTESIEPKCVQRPHPPVYVATYREEAAFWTAGVDSRCSRAASSRWTAFAAASVPSRTRAAMSHRCRSAASSLSARPTKRPVGRRGPQPRS